MRVNRGGLFEVNDQAYTFFIILEKNVRKHLTVLFRRGSTEADSKESVVDDIMNDEDILFNWMLMTTIDDDTQSKELLFHIVNLWLTIRGFSIYSRSLDRTL